ncbi:MAG: tetratricopeptide repeat protein [Cytophagales bacterium]
MKKIFVLVTFLLSGILFSQNVEQGLRFLEMEQYANARKNFQQMLKNAQTGENYYWMGEYYSAIEEVDSAMAMYKKGIEVEPKNGLNYVGVGEVYWNKNDTVQASKNFDQAISIRKRDARVYYKIATACINNEIKNMNKALTMIDKAIIYDKNNPEYHLVRGDVYMLKADGSNAVSNYNEALKINPKYVKAYIRKGKLYIRAKNYNEALKFYNEGIALDPTYYPAYRERAELYFMAGQTKKGLEDYKKYIDNSDDNFDTKFRYAKFIFKSKDYAEAIKYLTELQTKSPNNALINRLLGYSYCETGEFSKGISSIQKFFDNWPNDKLLASDYEYLGKLQIKSGKDTTAGVKNILKAVEMDEESISLISELAIMYQTIKKYKEAMRFYEMLVSKNKASVSEYLNYGKCAYFDGDYAKASEIFEKAIQFNPDITNFHLWKARCLAKQDPDYNKGLVKIPCDNYLDLVMKLDESKRNKKEMAEVYLYIGSYFCNKEKNKVEAENNWKKALEVDPGNKSAEAALKSIGDCGK